VVSLRPTRLALKVWGAHKTKQIWSKEGQIWSNEGIRHAQSDWISLVPKQMAAATIWPTK
jgi:hypothetical protein